MHEITGGKTSVVFDQFTREHLPVSARRLPSTAVKSMVQTYRFKLGRMRKPYKLPLSCIIHRI